VTPDDRGPTLVSCVEQGLIDVPLRDLMDERGRVRLNAEVENGDYFAVSLKGSQLSLRARGHVGFIPLNERITVHVRPRVPVANLTQIASRSGIPPTVLTSLRDYRTGSELWTDSMADLYTTALLSHLERIASAGFHREYRRQEAVTAFPRGRVLVGATAQRLVSRGVRHAAVSSWFERTQDTAVNRCIKLAIWLLAQHYIGAQPTGERRRLHRRLNAAFNMFEGVALDVGGACLTDPTVLGLRPLPALRAYYRDALNVASAVALQRTVMIESADGDVRLPSLVLNMNYVFEAYVRNSLRLQAVDQGWTHRVLDGNSEGAKLLFDTPPSPQATPDIVVADAAGVPAAVLEVKNVPVGPNGLSSRDAIEQAVTYGVSYGVRDAVLVHPRSAASEAPGMVDLGSLGGIRLRQYRMDLAARDLAVEERALAYAIAAMLSPPDESPTRTA
jgi:5-methylcytosine-specific restriction enzyme subunit McrC